MAVVQNRLESGAKAFESTRVSIENLSNRTKPPSPRAYVGTAVGIVIFLFGAVWALSWLLGERPTQVDVDRTMQEHRLEGGHPTADKAINDIKTEQVKQRTQLEEFRQQTDKKLDEIKEAVQPAKRRR